MIPFPFEVCWYARARVLVSEDQRNGVLHNL
jgi:hypothetical protein